MTSKLIQLGYIAFACILIMTSGLLIFGKVGKADLTIELAFAALTATAVIYILSVFKK